MYSRSSRRLTAASRMLAHSRVQRSLPREAWKDWSESRCAVLVRKMTSKGRFPPAVGAYRICPPFLLIATMGKEDQRKSQAKIVRFDLPNMEALTHAVGNPSLATLRKRGSQEPAPMSTTPIEQHPLRANRHQKCATQLTRYEITGSVSAKSLRSCAGDGTIGVVLVRLVDSSHQCLAAVSHVPRENEQLTGVQDTIEPTCSVSAVSAPPVIGSRLTLWAAAVHKSHAY